MHWLVARLQLPLGVLQSASFLHMKALHIFSSGHSLLLVNSCPPGQVSQPVGEVQSTEKINRYPLNIRCKVTTFKTEKRNVQAQKFANAQRLLSIGNPGSLILPKTLFFRQFTTLINSKTNDHSLTSKVSMAQLARA